MKTLTFLIRITLFSILVSMLFACDTVDGSKLKGYWKADRVTEIGEPLDLDLSEIAFEFKQNGRYSYYNTPSLSEEGRYEIKGNRLFTTDTTGASPMQKAVEIIRLDQDSLHIRMNYGGKEQVLYLFRVEETEDEDL